MNKAMNRINGLCHGAAAALVLTGLALGPAFADAAKTGKEEGTTTGRPTQCLRISLIDHTRVVDNQTILFFMRAGRAYQAKMDKPCPNLKREAQWTYWSGTDTLCPGQIITVRRHLAGGLPGASCAIKHLVRYVEAAPTSKKSQ